MAVMVETMLFTSVELAKECVRSLSSGFQAPETVAENGLDWAAFFQNFRIIGGISKEFVPLLSCFC